MNLVEHFRNARNIETIPGGIEVFRAGDRAGVMYVLIEGTAAIMVANKVVEIAGPGALIGEMALIDEKHRSATVVTRSRCRVVAVNRAQFDLLLHEKREFGRHVMRVMVERLRRMNDNLLAAQSEARVDSVAPEIADKNWDRRTTRLDKTKSP